MDELLHRYFFLDQEEEEEEEESLEDDDKSLDQPQDDDEIAEKLADEMGLDPEEDKELLDKLVKKEKANHEKLSGAIKQKIKWRTEAEKYSKENPDKSGKGKPQDKVETPDIDKLVDEKLNARLEARDLESLDLSDDLKAEVKDLAKTKGISVREAANLPYIRFRKEEIEKEERLKKATPTRSKKGTSFTRSIDPSKPLNIDDFKTADGNVDTKAWNEAKAERERLKNATR